MDFLLGNSRPSDYQEILTKGKTHFEVGMGAATSSQGQKNLGRRSDPEYHEAQVSHVSPLKTKNR